MLTAHLFARHKVKYEEHMQIQSCTLCDFTTNVKSRFSDHMRMHLNMRDMPCPECGKLFVTRKTLHSHMVKVHRPKSYKCSECPYATGVPNKLKEHMKLVHTHRHFKPYKCAYCKFLCASGGNCRKHIMRKHPGLDVKYIKLTEEEFNEVTTMDAQAEKFQSLALESIRIENKPVKSEPECSMMAKNQSSMMHVMDLSSLGVHGAQLEIPATALSPNNGHQLHTQPQQQLQQPQQLQQAGIASLSMSLPYQYNSELSTACTASVYDIPHQQEHKQKLY